MADEGVNYFPLYCVLDEKFELLEAEYGLKGFAIVVKLFQRIYKEHGYYCEWSNDISLMFAKQCGFSNVGVPNKNDTDSLGGADGSSPPGRSKNLIDLVVNASIRRGIFDKRLFEEYSILTSRGIQRNFLKIVRNRKEVEVKKEYLLLSDAEIKGNVVRTCNSDVRTCNSDVRIEQSKVKERKGKEIKNTTYSCPEPEKPAQGGNIQIPLNDNSFYVVPLAKISEWKEAFPSVDVECQLKRMVAWCNANPKRRKTKRGIQRFIVNWLSDDQDKGRRYYSGNKEKTIISKKQSDMPKEAKLEPKEELVGDDEEWWKYGINALEE